MPDLTALTDAGPVYRGRAALDLVASGAGFEAACEWLWTGNEEAAAWSIEGFGASPRRLGELLPAGTPPAQSLLLVLPALALRDPARFGAALPAEPARARELVLRLAAFLALGRDPQQVYEAYRTGGVAATAAKALGATPKGDALRLLDTALVLSLDRGLDEAALAARLASASGADLYAALAAGLAVLASPRVSGAVEQTESFFRNLENADAVRTVLTERLRRGEKIPGFGALPGEATVAHHLIGTAKNGKGVDVILETVGVLKNAGLGEPGAAVGLCAVVFAAGLPDDSAAAITLLARLAGLVAHVLEVRART
ncbi:MAG: citrate synthase [Deltaproteobacteria bacterium]|nr:citrate synthase [Deltaproteobacteria bacterium]